MGGRGGGLCLLPRKGCKERGGHSESWGLTLALTSIHRHTSLSAAATYPDAVAVTCLALFALRLLLTLLTRCPPAACPLPAPCLLPAHCPLPAARPLPAACPLHAQVQRREKEREEMLEEHALLMGQMEVRLTLAIAAIAIAAIALACCLVA